MKNSEILLIFSGESIFSRNGNLCVLLDSILEKHCREEFLERNFRASVLTLKIFSFNSCVFWDQIKTEITNSKEFYKQEQNELTLYILILFLILYTSKNVNSTLRILLTH